jgi:hypothetical protein
MGCHGSGRVVGKRVCFGPNPHNEYFDHATCYGTGWAPVQRTDVRPVREGFHFMMFECEEKQCGRSKLVNLVDAATKGFPVCHGEPMKPQPKKM